MARERYELKMREWRQFQRAMSAHLTGQDGSSPVATMMRLACEAESRILRRWASVWLRKHFNVAVTTVQKEETGNATPAAAANFH